MLRCAAHLVTAILNRLRGKEEAAERDCGSLQHGLVLCNHKVLVLVKEVVGLVADSTGVMLDGEACACQLGLAEAAALANSWRLVHPGSEVLICRLHHAPDLIIVASSLT